MIAAKVDKESAIVPVLSNSKLKNQLLSRRLALFFLLAIFPFLITTAGLAQDQDQEDDPASPVAEIPPRGAFRSAPQRQPVILSRPADATVTTGTLIALPAEADSYIASNRPNQNFGSDALYLGYNLAGTSGFGRSGCA